MAGERNDYFSPYRNPISSSNMNVVRDFVRGAMCLHVLHHASQTAIHGAWMAQELARHGYTISPGTLYPLLHRLESAGLLVSRTETVAGRSRRLYTCTTDGGETLNDLQRAVFELANEVLSGANDTPAPGQAGFPEPGARRQEPLDQR